MFQSKLPQGSKTWIYQCQRELSSAEECQIQTKIDSFLKGLDSHGALVSSESGILYHRFIVIVMDNSKASLCGSVGDRLLQFVQQLEKTFAISLLDRMQVAFKKEGNIHTVPMKTFKQLIAEGEIDENTSVFNNIITTNTELETDWEVPVKASWHSRMLPSPA